MDITTLFLMRSAKCRLEINAKFTLNKNAYIGIVWDVSL